MLTGIGGIITGFWAAWTMIKFVDTFIGWAVTIECAVGVALALMAAL